MAEKNILMQRKKTDGTFDIYYPQTKASQVKFEDGTTVEAHKSEIATEDTLGHIKLSDIPSPEIATQAEAEAGTNNTKMMTPLRTHQAIDGKVATQAEAEAGTNNTKMMTPLRVAQAINSLALPRANYCAPSDNLKAAADNEVTSVTSTSYSKVKEIRMKTKGVVRVSFDLKQSSSDSRPNYAIIRKNGVDFGTERTVVKSTVYSTFTEDLFYDVNDLLQLYTKREYGGASSNVRNFRVYFDNLMTVDENYVPEVLLD